MEDSSEYIPVPHTAPQYLVARFSHLGDVLLTTGVIAKWSQQINDLSSFSVASTEMILPEVAIKFSVLTSRDFAPVFENNPYINKIHALDLKNMPVGKLFKEFKKLSAAYKQTMLVDLHSNLRTMLLKTLWHGPCVTYDKLGMERRIFLSSHGKFYRGKLLQSNVPQRYEQALGFKPSSLSSLRPQVWLTSEESEYGRQCINSIFPQETRPVAIHPYAAHPHKTFPPERWRNVLELFDKYSINWVVIGKGQPLVPGDPRDLVNKCSLRQSASVLSHCRGLVTGDSGPMHLAAAVNTPVVAIFGPTTREWGFYPFGEKDVVIDVDLPCRPCSLHGKAECKINGKCLEDIRLEQILDAVDNLK